MMITGFWRAAARGGLTLYVVLAFLPGATLAASEGSTAGELSPAVAITIDAENLIELYQSVPDVHIVDARHPEDYRLGHIEQSHNLPLHIANCEALAQIIADRDAAIVFYCNGGDADVSLDTLQMASACGYQRLFWLRGGFIEWQDKDYPYVIE